MDMLGCPLEPETPHRRSPKGEIYMITRDGPGDIKLFLALKHVQQAYIYSVYYSYSLSYFYPSLIKTKVLTYIVRAYSKFV